MANAFKKTSIIILVIVGGLAGYWLARENQRIFELPYRERHSQTNALVPSGQRHNICVGMDIWQVKEALGPPEKRHVISENEHGKKEVWTYGKRQLYFENGFLTRWQE